MKEYFLQFLKLSCKTKYACQDKIGTLSLQQAVLKRESLGISYLILFYICNTLILVCDYS